MKLRVARIGLHRDFEVLDRVREALRAIATEAQQRLRLHVLGFRFRRRHQGRDGRVEAPLLELGQAQIQLHSGQLRIQSNCFLVGRSRFLILLFLRKHHTQARERSSIFRISPGHGPPDLGSLSQFPLLFEGDRLGRAGRLAARRTRHRQRNRRQL